MIRNYNKEENPHLRYAITFGEVAVLHVGGSSIGEARRDSGFSVDSLKKVRDEVAEKGYVAELVMISDRLPVNLRKENEAAILVIRNGCKLLLGNDGAANELLEEHKKIEYDTMFFDRGKLKHKRARHNIMFGNVGRTHSADYRECSIVAFSSIPLLERVRDALPRVLGDGARGLCAEGNRYFEAKSKIGYHGDAERKIVICCSLGATNVLRYHWRMPHSSEHTLEAVDVRVEHGDLYVMSEKATGYDWRHRSRVRVVHGVNCE